MAEKQKRDDDKNGPPEKKLKPKDYKGVIVGMGNPLLDISAEVPADLLEKYEVKLNNAILATEKHVPLYQELVDKFNVEYIAGGATQNSIRVAQWMLQKPGACSYIGSVGKDKFGDQLRKSAEGDNIRVYYHEDDKAATGTCAVLIQNKERSLIANLAAANNFKIDHLKKSEVESVWKNAQYYYSAGFFLTVSPESVLLLAQHYHENKKTVLMNLSAPFICEFFNKPLLECMPYVNYLIGNESEAQAFAKAMKYEDDSAEAVAEKIGKLPRKDESRERVVIITQGSKPTAVYANGKVVMVPVPELPADEIVDANGAGDAFVGGFLAYLVQDYPLLDCVRAGHYAASVILRVSGTKLSGEPKFKL